MPWPTAFSRALPVRAASAAVAPHLPPAPHLPRIVCPSFNSAGSDGVQPASELRHVQRHGHGRHVRRALQPSVGPSPCTPLAPPSPPPASRAASRPASCALLSTRQYARAFNQPLSFDTPKVTTMYSMFLVRSARALGSAFSRSQPFTPLAPPPPHGPLASRPAPRPASYALLPSRQGARAFNQPLSFDTSKVTNTGFMFSVRSARAPNLQVRPSPSAPHAYRLRRYRPHAPTPSRLPSRLPSRTSPRFVCPAFDLAERAHLQPAAEPRHVQRHGHALHV